MTGGDGAAVCREGVEPRQHRQRQRGQPRMHRVERELGREAREAKPELGMLLGIQ